MTRGSMKRARFWAMIGLMAMSLYTIWTGGVIVLIDPNFIPTSIGFGIMAIGFMGATIALVDMEFRC